MGQFAESGIILILIGIVLFVLMNKGRSSVGFGGLMVKSSAPIIMIIVGAILLGL